MDEYLAVIKMFAGNFYPRTFEFCNGQLISIAQNTALFSLLGTTYGGDGRVTYGLPDLRGRVPVGAGQGPGLPFIQLGEMAGDMNRTLLTSNLPAHSHGILASENKPDQSSPVDNYFTVSPAVGSGPNASQLKSYSSTVSDKLMKSKTTETGQGMPLSIMQPFLGMNYIITTQGIFPSRP